MDLSNASFFLQASCKSFGKTYGKDANDPEALRRLAAAFPSLEILALENGPAPIAGPALAPAIEDGPDPPALSEIVPLAPPPPEQACKEIYK